MLLSYLLTKTIDERADELIQYMLFYCGDLIETVDDIDAVEILIPQPKTAGVESLDVSTYFLYNDVKQMNFGEKLNDLFEDIGIKLLTDATIKIWSGGYLYTSTDDNMTRVSIFPEIMLPRYLDKLPNDDLGHVEMNDRFKYRILRHGEPNGEITVFNSLYDKQHDVQQANEED